MCCVYIVLETYCFITLKHNNTIAQKHGRALLEKYIFPEKTNCCKGGWGNFPTRCCRVVLYEVLHVLADIIQTYTFSYLQYDPPKRFLHEKTEAPSTNLDFLEMFVTPPVNFLHIVKYPPVLIINI